MMSLNTAGVGKRKIAQGGGGGGGGGGPTSEEERRRRKKQRKSAAKMRQKQRASQPTKEESRVAGRRPAGQQAAFFMKQLADVARLSSLELDAYRLKGSHFKTASYLAGIPPSAGASTAAPTTGEQHDASTPPPPPTLPAVSIEQLMKGLNKPSWLGGAGGVEGGSPRVLVVCQGALRAVDVARAFAPARCGVAKLFAKHMKEAEQAEYLRGSKAKVAVGTPHRLHRLCAIGALKLSHAALLVIDTSPDVKGQTIFDQKDLRGSLMSWYKEALHALVVSGQIKLCIL